MGSGMRGALTAWLALIALEAVSRNGSGRVADLLGDVNRLVNRALSPKVPAIPDRRTGGSTGGSTAGTAPQYATSSAGTAGGTTSGRNERIPAPAVPPVFVPPNR